MTSRHLHRVSFVANRCPEMAQNQMAIGTTPCRPFIYKIIKLSGLVKYWQVVCGKLDEIAIYVICQINFLINT